jgi:hypothetical protein
VQFDRANASLTTLPQWRYGCMPAAETARWADRVRATVRRQLDLDAVEPFAVVDVTDALCPHQLNGQARGSVGVARARGSVSPTGRRPAAGSAVSPVVGICAPQSMPTGRITREAHRRS